jgi:uncharacterized protein YlxW (UPF0749 family)
MTAQQQDVGRQRPDASMSLLSDLMRDSLDGGYAEAAARKRAVSAADGGQPEPPRGLRRWTTPAVLLVGLGLVGLLLAVSFMQVRNREPATAEAKQRLINEIDRRTDNADRLEAQVAALQSEVAKARRNALAVSGSGATVAEELERLETVTGTAPVEGPGIVVSVDDAAAVGETGAGDVRDDTVEDGRVQDRDLQVVVNGLWAAGAEAVSINGRRLTGLTAIRSAGEPILVGYRPLSPPYVISAIGDPRRLEAAFADGPGGRYLQLIGENFGVRYDVKSKDQLRLPGAAGVTLREATVGSATTSSPSSTTGPTTGPTSGLTSRSGS